MSYNRNAYRGRSGYRSSAISPGRVARVNKRAGACRDCGEEIPAGGGQLWRETSGAWSVVHCESHQGGWLMHPEPVRGGCPEATDKRNAELFAANFFNPGTPAPVSERAHIASAAAAYAASNPVQAESARAGSKYAYLPDGTRMTMSSRRCEDAPCCGCCD